MKQLEKVYLSIVLNYLKHFSVIVKFILINKKCWDACQMMKINPMAIDKMGQHSYMYILEPASQLRNELEILNRIDTIKITADLFLVFLKQLKEKSQDFVIQNRFYSYNFKFLEGFEKRILNIHLYIDELHHFEGNFKGFTRLQQLTIESNNVSLNLLHILPESQQFMKLLHIIGSFDQQFVNHISEYRIQRVIIESSRSFIESLPLSKSISNVLLISNDWKDSDVNHLTIHQNKEGWLKWNINESNHCLFNQLYYPSKLIIHGQGSISSNYDINDDSENIVSGIDFSSYNQLCSLSLQTNSVPITLPTSLTYLELNSPSENPVINCPILSSFSLVNTQNPITLSFSSCLTSIKLTHSQCIIEEPLLQIKEIELFSSILYNDFVKMTSLTKMILVECSIIFTQLPDSLLDLSLISCKSRKSIPSTFLPSHLSSIKIHSCDFLFPMNFPQSLQSLDLFIENEVTECIDLMPLKLISLYVRGTLVNVVIPTTLQKLYLYGIKENLNMDFSHFSNLKCFAYENGKEIDSFVLPSHLHLLKIQPVVPHLQINQVDYIQCISFENEQPHFKNFHTDFLGEICSI
ncbi:hypothetical protein KM1_281940 [Entamoeba histolytica HM-3:IMSS]|uniref:Leucine-rich repeat containing protein n=6 Tax=Entamoeba histolytica TaxID=5759 RepID=C4M8Q7_ENTH1|nr:hypothetical protein EHI_056090 [Entamoeba histolytica HM-1:IMSS]EMD43840.1 Hypothetical protein EHI5A_222660 [Entamoeba histolytica KU27]EMS13410.1 hypothetical protein KM1_281940 [Entamoeba histolytica HM-3:IMSS]ENY61186.1 hypothetical protein EHI7A_176760 [Entamoeba histolytica HM-1:IMSS-A]GAT97998.1 hypothetical protein CL6EHI_056090 [Entamoeba histolytica]EAL47211.1 hypothetical protein EHI_056090 [Entamoeba histolytica HM-1:IMSS]|eukprot:XP_652597.1 hypothetical protein EHI_056090 [Entamoeba histolytica HM-1:IMSS]